MLLAEEEDIETGPLEISALEGERALCEADDWVGVDYAHYFDGHTMVLHGWINKHEEGLIDDWLVFLIFEQIQIVSEECIHTL